MNNYFINKIFINISLTIVLGNDAVSYDEKNKMHIDISG